MRVLVTGGLGVNGAWVSRELVDQGHDVIVADNRLDLSLLGERYAAQLRLEEVDICSQEDVERLFAEPGIDCVVHMAAAVGHEDKDPAPARTFRINAEASVTLMEKAAAAGVKRFVFASSRAVYGGLDGDHAHPTYRPVKETTQTRPESTYDLCKVVSEEFGKAFAAATPMEFAALRFATIFGPGKLMRHGRFGALSRLIEAPYRGEPVEIAHGGDQSDDLIYAEEAARGVVAAVVAPTLAHDVYNIATGRSYTLGDMADAVRRFFPDARISIGDGLNYLGTSTNYSGVLDASRARRDLGFEADADLVSVVGRYYQRLRELDSLKKGGQAPPYLSA
ncbi:NAD(P)-dependent oxidoreductase [Marivibrio halodurans]|uniref:NAD(P)-dependent oxidoreductase n=1 Tax=Marivibrio halodurans TaxID=2039722 RepID=A0A8J7V2S5_9PROT|nr:NAD(P)-dependent oxidoreductase [Marivibrio halodurans]MBP5857471.1 NAD(P)-dependent oxidoreductase [Marivibrio halodurans]